VKINKKILFIGGGVETLPGINIARNMGLKVVVSDINPEAPGLLAADYGILASTYDIEETIKRVKEHIFSFSPIDGVICLGVDVPRSVAAIAKLIGSNGISEKAAFLASEKYEMKECFSKYSLNVPWYSKITNIRDLKSILNINKGSFVIKPVDSRGARGVLKIDSNSDIDWAYRYSMSYSPSKVLILEKYLDGPQFSTESIIIDGKCYTPGFSDRNYEYLDKYAPNIIENGGDLPSKLPKKNQLQIMDLVSAAASALGIKNGVVKGDMVFHNGEPYIIELAARLSGGLFCTHEIPLNTGIEFVKIAILQALGEKIDLKMLKPKFNKGVAQRYFFPQPGKVESIFIPEWINESMNVKHLDIRVKVGDYIGNIDNHPSRAGMVITQSNKRDEAITIAELVVKSVKIVTV